MHTKESSILKTIKWARYPLIIFTLYSFSLNKSHTHLKLCLGILFYLIPSCTNIKLNETFQISLVYCIPFARNVWVPPLAGCAEGLNFKSHCCTAKNKREWCHLCGCAHMCSPHYSVQLWRATSSMCCKTLCEVLRTCCGSTLTWVCCYQNISRLDVLNTPTCVEITLKTSGGNCFNLSGNMNFVILKLCRTQCIFIALYFQLDCKS